MQNYELRCRKLSGEYLSARLGEFENLLDALDSVTGEDTPLPGDCTAWLLQSADGLEMAGKLG